MTKNREPNLPLRSTDYDEGTLENAWLTHELHSKERRAIEALESQLF